MSRIGKQPITVPSGVDVTIDGAHVAVKGPKGQLEHDDRRRRHDRRAKATTLIVDARRRRAANRSLHGLSASLVDEHGHRRLRRVRRRSSRSSASATAPRRRARTASSSRSGSRTRVQVRGARRASRFEVPAADAHHRARLRQATRRPGRGRHPQDPQARALQGQGHPLRRRAHLRKAGKSAK